ncbi:MAG TPA: hypothetical protein VMT35_06370, partial [Ignavibacteriaceae bacterium]|nr:hypothetical protein [Ignavibacteriaceae bacterium]
PYNSELYKEGLVQFRNNMSELLIKFSQAKIPVIISDLVSNEKDLPPFHSLENKNYPSALYFYKKAQVLESKKLFDEAKINYLKAKDLDAIRFRASEDINKIIYDLSNSLKINFISLKSIFEENSAAGIVGNNLMTEHLHPNINGYFLMAGGFFNAIKNNGMIETGWDTSRIKSLIYYRNNWGFSELDSTIADLRIQHLKSGWPFKADTIVNSFISTYKPKGIVDSLAFLTIKYGNISLEKLHKALAKYYVSAGELKRASKEYLSLAYLFPTNKSYYYFSADYAYKAKDYDNAIRVIKISPDFKENAYALFNLSTMYLSKKNYKEALFNIEEYLKLSLEKKNILMGEKLKYQIQKDSGLVSESEITLASIKKSDPSFNSGDSGKRLIVLIPESVKPYIEKAEFYRRRGELNEALTELNEANKIKETAYSNLWIGKILAVQKNPEAVKYLEKAYTEFKDDPSLIYSLSLLYIMRKDFSKAKTTINDFVRVKGENNAQYRQLKDLYEKQLRKN